MTEPEVWNCEFIVYATVELGTLPLVGTLRFGAWIVKSGMLFTVPSYSCSMSTSPRLKNWV